jgi:cbb3-type cytochrome oxidase subunit 3
VGILLLYTPWLIRVPAQISSASARVPDIGVEEILLFGYNITGFHRSIAGYGIVFISSLLLVYLFIVILFYLARENITVRFEKVIIACCLLVLPVAICFTYTYVGLGDAFSDRRLIFTIIPLLLLVGESYDVLENKVFKNIVIFVLVSCSIYVCAWMFNTDNKENWREAAEYVSSLRNGNDAVILNPGFISKPLYYYGVDSNNIYSLPKGTDRIYNSFPLDVRKIGQDEMRAIKEYKEIYSKVIIVSSHAVIDEKIKRGILEMAIKNRKFSGGKGITVPGTDINVYVLKR